MTGLEWVNNQINELAKLKTSMSRDEFNQQMDQLFAMKREIVAEDPNIRVLSGLPTSARFINCNRRS